MKFLWNILAICLPLGLVSQPIITIDNFPHTGDTLFFLTDELPDKIFVSPPGPDQKWNYTTLQAPFVEFETVEPASSGRYYKDFPASDIVLRSSKGVEKYLRIVGTRLDVIGLGGNISEDDIAIRGKQLWSGELPVVVANLKYKDDLDFHSSSKILLGRLEIPGEYLEALWGDPDSLIIEKEVSRRITADAWGQLLLPGGLFDVLRVRYVDEIKTRVHRKSGRSWTDVTHLLPVELLGPSRMISYRFFTEGKSQQVAVLHTDEDEIVRSVEYLTPKSQAQFYQKPKIGQWLYAYPNPAIATVRFKFLEIEPGEYSIRFFNILGKTLFDRRYLINGSKTVQIDISHLEKGTYLYSLLDRNGNKLITKRLIIVKP